jgi:hypothetical protein
MEGTALEVSAFLNRIRSLQWYCSETDTSSPRALIFIPGPDGRNNSGSTNILKYLFRGSLGKSLYDETVEDTFEILEDMVILIKENSVAFIYRYKNTKMKSSNHNFHFQNV